MSKTKNHKNMSTDERIYWKKNDYYKNMVPLNVIRKLIGEINISRYDQKTYRGIVNEIFSSVEKNWSSWW